MNYKKIASFICALCVFCTAMPFTADYYEPSVTADAADSSNNVKFTSIGQYTQVSLSNTTETPAWYSDNTNVAVVDSTGKITAVGEGTCTVYAVFSSQVLSFNITVELPEEQTDFFLGSIDLSNDKSAAVITLNGVDTSNAQWSCSDTSVAAVDQNGKVTAVGSGSCTVTASVGGKNYIVNVTSSYVKTTEPVTVTEVILGNLELSNIQRSAKITLSGVPDGVTVAWSSSNENIASVSADGTVTAVNSGECSIIALIEGVKYITYVKSSYDPSTATPAEVVLGDMTLTNDNSASIISLSGVPDGASIVWSSSDESVATVDRSGKVTAVGSGNCKIIALINGINYVMNVTSTYSPVAEPAIKADSASINGIGNTIQLSVINSSEKPEWMSMDQNVAVVDENGTVTAVSEGQAVIIAKLSGKILSITINVSTSVFYGDADLSGNLSINDAAVIMSHVSNAEKYPLTEEALNNADVYQRGDGISNMDALAVQKKIAQLISELPESYINIS